MRKCAQSDQNIMLQKIIVISVVILLHTNRSLLYTHSLYLYKEPIQYFCFYTFEINVNSDIRCNIVIELLQNYFDHGKKYIVNHINCNV